MNTHISTQVQKENSYPCKYAYNTTYSHRKMSLIFQRNKLFSSLASLSVFISIVRYIQLTYYDILGRVANIIMVNMVLLCGQRIWVL